MKKCKKCKKDFITTPDRTTFCSHKCQARWACTLSHGKPKPGAKKGSTIKCVNCDKQFYVPLYRVKLGKSKYCSKSCLAKRHLSQFDKGFKPLGLPPHKYKTITVNGKSIRLHRHIIQEHLGRKLESWEHVHHINGDSYDNRIDNLCVLSNSDHQKTEHKYRKSFIFSCAPNDEQS